MTTPTHSARDDFDNKVAEETASTLFQLAWGLIKRLGEKGWEEITIRKAMERYAHTFRERYGEVKILGMSQPVPLHEIYVAVQLLGAELLDEHREEIELENNFRASGRKHASDRVISDGVDIANHKRMLNILGAPGTGKSTFLRRLGYEAMLPRLTDRADLSVPSRYRHKKLPVLLELRRFRNESDNLDLIGRIASEFETCGFPRSRQFVESALGHGGLFVLLDGLDEVSNARLDHVVSVVRDFIDQYGHEKADGEGNRFVISCRTAHYKNYFQRFEDYVLADFGDEQIKTFAANWFSKPVEREERIAEVFVQHLHIPANASTLELARTPLLLAFLCIAFSRRQELPRIRATLYKQALEVMLFEWNASKLIHKEPVYAELTPELELDMLAQMSESLFREDRFFFTREQAQQHIQSFMQSELNAPRTLDARQILTAIEVQQGLIVRRAQDAYSFSHLTIQEYLTAKHLWDNGWATDDKVKLFVDEQLFEPRWAVVFELLAGMGKADPLLLAMADCVQRRLMSAAQTCEAVANLLTWMEELSIGVNSAGGPVWHLTVARIALYAFSRAMFDAFAPNGTQNSVGAIVGLAYQLNPDFAHGLFLAADADFEYRFSKALHQRTSPALIRAKNVLDWFAAKFTQRPSIPERIAEGQELLHRSSPNPEDIVAAIQLPIVGDNAALSSLSACMAAWGLVVRCRSSAYRTTADVWNKICESILHQQDLNSCG